MDDRQAFETIAAERRDLADVLDTLAPEQWSAPSLCGRWTVREVAAHLMIGPTGTLLGFVGAMVRARGRFEVANQALAAERAKAPTEQLVGDLRARATSRFTPPGHDWHAPLTDLLVHRMDMLVPLGLADAHPPRAAWDDALDLLASPKGRSGFVARGLPQLEYVATDTDWRSGSGPRVQAPGRALALAMTRRTPYVDLLEGPGASTLAAWAAGA